MRAVRFFWFVVSILAGLAAGFYLAWQVFPVSYSNLPPDTLREDYRADYVLMVAEAYALDADAQAVTRRLSLLGQDEPVRIVQQAIIKGRELNYPARDISLMVKLSEVLAKASSTPVPGATP